MKKIVGFLLSFLLFLNINPVLAGQIGQSSNVTGLSGEQTMPANVVSYDYDGLTFNMLERVDRFENSDMAFDFRAAGSMINLRNEYVTFWLVDVTNLNDLPLTYAEMLHYDTVLYVEDAQGNAENLFFYYLPITLSNDLSFQFVDYPDPETLEMTELASGDTASFLFYAYIEDLPEGGRSFMDVHGDIIVDGFPFNY